MDGQDRPNRTAEEHSQEQEGEKAQIETHLQSQKNGNKVPLEGYNSAHNKAQDSVRNVVAQ